MQIDKVIVTREIEEQGSEAKAEDRTEYRTQPCRGDIWGIIELLGSEWGTLTIV